MGDMIDKDEAALAIANVEIGYHDGIGGDWHPLSGPAIISAACAVIRALPPAPDAVGACPKCGGNREQWLRCSNFTCPGGDVFGRLPTTSSPDAVQALVKAVEKLGLRELVAGWNGENKDKPYAPHPPSLGATIKTTCGVVYEVDAAIRAAQPDAVEALVKAAEAWERERCAKVAESYWSGIPESEVGEAVCDAVFAVAAAIRAGGKP